ncbi:hypothetical protein [Xenorhabdus sp. Sc-CR9]|uniref:hypothetical protein n=1 Tax=Xenorhabdus sp. Sc-CR9 TaxID=2584468 RepID=UPI001F319A35|nr:hypothetical protein [Xenorhabdus sp. Sc-CR9]
MKKIIVAVSLILFSFCAYSATTYTKEQLNSMVNSGRYPDQLSTATTNSSSMNFSDCKKSARDITNQIASEYPVEEIVDSNILFMVKLWANDGVIMVTCSEPDRKMIVTQSEYK